MYLCDIRVGFSCKEEVAVAQSEATPVMGEPLDINSALPLVVRKSQDHGADDCNQPDYIKLVKALCADHNVKLLHAPSSKTLGEWAGDYGEQHEAVEVVKQHKD
ncbi:Detected protein of unknown function [Hibiscus syriacus]|uniref:Ribosomal protein eL8/eL30/eS12/Gadd45 domain-containing protein n=1 Tax=Hibiscus syriacus TaxID=106335 RepID=A0A6A2YH72_HIBSY|nr:Detected protein of unknown function [Hibiscus syriacus]